MAIKKEFDMGDTHPTLAARLKPYCLRFGKVVLGKLLKWVGKEVKDMPTLPGYTDAKGGTACWSHILGGCKWGNCRFKHVDRAAITDAFVEEIWAVLGPAVEAALQQPVGKKKGGAA